ncbi:PREDICTED: G patch domain and ankyrin repeat-containing protein 1 [Nanorana parkeri]|uniref:G patch domain and ankyrin repeat-containing protein 1 n=1 Tax=Nanorana parkeri TaxID=125878 RepID=UPI0008542D46|nr:PREDICTED: G patch domain and ankyrin repeat-containing protein 1 [Nanorana parkeri]XP_018420284.1 PREDICTED: G patch domain and ankyrin repeat-containing protein 1 [Nanorana parkeri]
MRRMYFPRLITFTKAREKSDLWENGERTKKRPFNSTGVGHTGEEARSFYESLLANDEEPPAPRKPSRKRRAHRSPPQEEPRIGSSQGGPNTSVQEPMNQKAGHQLLRCSQYGDMKGLRQLVEKEHCDINFHDGYYWTPLMSAAFAGNKDAVSYLLKRGAAWVGVCETRGKDALRLAEEGGHREVVKLLQDSLKGQPQESQPRAQPPERKFCDVCKTHYQEDSIEIHERSTVHLFNKKKKLPATYYAIPEHNVGFKMMVKEGWDRESGLGPEGSGRKFPIQTVLKRDQKGLGFQRNEKPKVTHFASNDTQAVARPQTTHMRTERVATVSKKEEKRKEDKTKAWERNLRTYMNIDF